MERTIERLGLRAFRGRGYIPLLLLPFLAAAALTANPIDASALTARDAVALAVTMSGLFLRAVVAGHVSRQTSGRRTDFCQARRLNTTGLYSVVRHPTYAGSILATLGLALLPGQAWIVALFAVFLLVHYGLIMAAEDTFLRRQFGDEYERWARSTRALIPDFRRWRPWDLPFSARTVARREYPGWFAAALAFPAIKLLQSARDGLPLELAPGWIVIAVAGTAVFVIVRAIKYRTRLLHVPGR